MIIDLSDDPENVRILTGRVQDISVVKTVKRLVLDQDNARHADGFYECH